MMDEKTYMSFAKNNCHLQQDAECVADIVGVVFHKALGAIAALKQESAAFAYFGKVCFQASSFASKNKRRESGKAFFHRLQDFRIFICRHLLDRKIPPAIQSPFFVHRNHPVHL